MYSKLGPLIALLCQWGFANSHLILLFKNPVYQRHHSSKFATFLVGPELQGPQQESAAIVSGQTAQLTCHVEANPPAQVTWYRYTGIHVVAEATIRQNPNASGLFTPTVLSERLLESFSMAETTESEFLVTFKGKGAWHIVLSVPVLNTMIAICGFSLSVQRIICRTMAID